MCLKNWTLTTGKKEDFGPRMRVLVVGGLSASQLCIIQSGLSDKAVDELQILRNSDITGEGRAYSVTCA